MSLEFNDILLYTDAHGKVKVEVIYEDESFWLSQKKMAELFDVSVPTINEHLQNIFKTHELQESATIRKFRIVQREGNRDVNREIDFYNLDAIIAVGYRVNSHSATQFRIWATATLKEFIIKGFVLDDERMKQGKRFGKDYFDELLERIREIRASERRFYQKITDIYRDCSIDYSANAGQVLAIAQTMKLVKLGQISLDGTKIKANASKHKALSHGHIEKLEAQLREEVQALLAKAAETDQQEANDEHDLPAEIARREQRLQALADAKAKMAERIAQRDNHAQQDYADKVARREALREAGQKPRGKEPKAPETGPKATDQINLTDEESRIMPSHEGFVQAYNGQAAVDVDSMLIVTATLTQDTNDLCPVGTNSKSSRCWTNWLNWKAVSANPIRCC